MHGLMDGLYGDVVGELRAGVVEGKKPSATGDGKSVVRVWFFDLVSKWHNTRTHRSTLTQRRVGERGIEVIVSERERDCAYVRRTADVCGLGPHSLHSPHTSVRHAIV